MITFPKTLGNMTLTTNTSLIGLTKTNLLVILSILHNISYDMANKCHLFVRITRFCWSLCGFIHCLTSIKQRVITYAETHQKPNYWASHLSHKM
jgi:hypothetical protein